MTLFLSTSSRFAFLSLLFFSVGLNAAELRVKIVAEKERPVHQTVVELIGPDGDTTQAAHVEIIQEDKEFLPELSIIGRGSTVAFINHDSFKHHVYSVSKGNKFDLPLYQGKPANLITFDTPGVVTLGCNIHDWMLAFAYIKQSDRVSIADADGQVVFGDLEAGSYQLKVWNPRLRNNKKIIISSIEITENQLLEKEVTLRLRKKVRKRMRHENDGGYNF